MQAKPGFHKYFFLFSRGPKNIGSHIGSHIGVTLHSLMMKVERIQYQAAPAITGAWQGSSRSKMYDELGWESLSDRRKCRRSLQVHKIINNSTLSYLKVKLPPNCREMFSGTFVLLFMKLCVNQIDI
jgi:hypothetical protein